MLLVIKPVLLYAQNIVINAIWIEFFFWKIKAPTIKYLFKREFFELLNAQFWHMMPEKLFLFVYNLIVLMYLLWTPELYFFLNFTLHSVLVN